MAENTPKAFDVTGQVERPGAASMRPVPAPAQMDILTLMVPAGHDALLLELKAYLADKTKAIEGRQLRLMVNG